MVQSSVADCKYMEWLDKDLLVSGTWIDTEVIGAGGKRAGGSDDAQSGIGRR